MVKTGFIREIYKALNMSHVSVRYPNGNSVSVAQHNVECPFCKTRIIPNYLCIDYDTLYASCPNDSCRKHFILSLGLNDLFTVIEPNTSPQTKVFSEIIISISPQFASIYNQAYHAEQMRLDQICGVGYRKALEFLIKDYLISKVEDDAKKENIKNKFLNNCIQDDVQNENIKNVAKRAAWLGNDETHYTRKWEDKDVSHLKHLIDLTVRWIENEVETERVLQEMS